MIRENPFFYYPFFLALTLGLVVLLCTNKGEVVLFINHRHTPFFDALFYYGTTLGNGLFYLLVILVLFAIRYGYAFIGTVSFSITGLLILFLKRVVFSSIVRPTVFFGGEDLHYVEGVKILSYHSFPSGHTAMAFSLFCLLALLIPRKRVDLLLVLMALIAGVSRIYLVQHFFIDVYFGAIIGVLFTTLTYHFITGSEWYKSKRLFQRGLLKNKVY